VNDLERAQGVEATFRVLPGLYLIGSLERGVTVYSQQLRAHNLVWALWEIQKKSGEQEFGRVAIVGGGIAGLTAAACFLCLFDRAVSVTIFEQLWDLCPLQQGSDGRWLHPRIHDWPLEGSRVPGASLPILDWSEGRASDVTRTIIHDFSAYCEAFAKPNGRLSLYLGLRHFQIDAKTRDISWVATKTARAGAFFHLVSCLANIDCDMRDQVICRRDHWDGATNQAIKG
jgi:NAD(P)-binding Rossmann-like domain